MAAIYRGIPNHVQIGINDTRLTLALERGDYKTAEVIIAANNEAAYLDEGPFEKTPLTLVLSNDLAFRAFPRHLRFAKLLVEGGANPNLRIPLAEWQGASPSPMEQLIDLYNMTIDNVIESGFHERFEGKMEMVSPLSTIGLHDETDLTLPLLKEQLLELLDIFLACGGNPNVTTISSNSTLYHIVVARPNPDVDLLMKLSEADSKSVLSTGGDLNQTNVHGSTPLMDLVTYADGDLALDILRDIWRTKPNISSLVLQNCSNETPLWRAMFAGSPGVALEFLQKGASPIPRAYVTIGKSFGTVRPYMSRHPLSSNLAINEVSSIFAALLQDSSSYNRHTAAYVGRSEPLIRLFSVSLMDKVFSIVVNPVVDALPGIQCFPDTVIEEIIAKVSSETKFKLEPLLETASKPQDVAQLIFGKLSAGLQQMCVRVLMNHGFFSTPACNSLDFIAHLNGTKVVRQEEHNNRESVCWDSCEDIEKDCLKEDDKTDKDDDVPQNSNADSKENCNDVEKLEHADDDDDEWMDIEQYDATSCHSNNIVEDVDNISDWNVVMELNDKVIEAFVKNHLKLPASLVPRFKIEAIRLQLGASQYSFESTDCVQSCEGQSDEESDIFSEDETDEENDWFDSDMSSEDSEFNFSEEESDEDVEEEVEVEEGEEEEEGQDYDSHGDKDEDSGNDAMDIEKEIDSPLSVASQYSERNYTLSEDSSGDQVPDTICRERYEPFDNDQNADTVSSSEDTSHSTDNLKNV
ncbi:hypothetical protein C0J52_04252 [Blattella germanica]|nr:hypothetical protein C0J52_04252 [Blattella germanica]